MDLGFSGGYHVCISNQYADAWFPCDNPWIGILYSGTPHTPEGVWSESLGGRKIRLHWRPEIYGTWPLQIIAYRAEHGWVQNLNGPSGCQAWHFIDYCEAGYDPGR